MSLFIRVDVGFWSHRKTLRLRALIGDAAFWLPPRLWAYAAQQQPNGDFSGFMAEEIAMLVGYPGDAQALLQALRQSGFMDDMQLHDWEEHNGYHKSFSDRAKKAANARWEEERRRQEKTRQEKRRDKQCLGHAQASIPKELESEDFQRAWSDWYAYRQQAKLKPYTEIGAQKQLTALAKIGPIRAVAAIDRSIAQGYQGIFESNDRNGQTAAAQQQAAKRNGEYQNRKPTRVIRVEDMP